MFLYEQTDHRSFLLRMAKSTKKVPVLTLALIAPPPYLRRPVSITANKTARGSPGRLTAGCEYKHCRSISFRRRVNNLLYHLRRSNLLYDVVMSCTYVRTCYTFSLRRYSHGRYILSVWNRSSAGSSTREKQTYADLQYIQLLLIA